MPTPPRITRRQMLVSAAASGVAATSAVHGLSSTTASPPRSKVERLGIGAVGMRYQGTVITDKARLYGDVVAIADVDRLVLEQARASFGGTPRIFEDYQDLIARPDVDVLMIGTPDHWHAKMVVDACRAGKDVYCEKPLTLTIDEGKLIRDVVRETGRIVQVGSWQRSDYRFRQAVELVRQGRLGTLLRVEVVLGKNESGGPFQPVPIPRHLNWDLWQGQTQDEPYLVERSHYTFRWWYEYSGGQMTDWGAHHLDIAQWAIDSLPVKIEARAEYPRIPHGYNVATQFSAHYQFANGVSLSVSDHGRNGILFVGSSGRLFVNRGTLAGKVIDDAGGPPISPEEFAAYDGDNLQRPPRAGKLEAIVNHLGNFFDCVHHRRPPISEVEGQHQSATTCHLGNIAMQLGRPLEWDPQLERFVNDAAADRMLRREPRRGFKIT